MKIGILTQPLKTNYGCLMQNFALQKAIECLGHVPLTIRCQHFKFYRNIRLLRLFAKHVLGKNIDSVADGKAKNLVDFIKRNINVTRLINPPLSFRKLHKYNLDAFIVGSDQVFRKKYSPHFPSFLLDFLPKGNNALRISYAASFGVDAEKFKEEMDPCSIADMAQSLKRFDSISVRELSGKNICSEFLGVNAKFVLDPTLLFDKAFYCELLEKESQKYPYAKRAPIFAYILDSTEAKDILLRRAISLFGGSVFDFLAESKSNLEEPHPPISDWLNGFYSSDFVITDSFHGTVFSIIFNKPFVVLGNYNRGMERFISLLALVGLDDRLIDEHDINAFDRLISMPPIDWRAVDAKLDEMRKISFDFIKNSLG